MDKKYLLFIIEDHGDTIYSNIWVIPFQIYNKIFDCTEICFPRSIDDKKGHVFFLSI